ncbi:hypothetical protein AMTR_s00057p00126460, partial [Amborella trichopoda]
SRVFLFTWMELLHLLLINFNVSKWLAYRGIPSIHIHIFICLRAPLSGVHGDKCSQVPMKDRPLYLGASLALLAVVKVKSRPLSSDLLQSRKGSLKTCLIHRVTPLLSCFAGEKTPTQTPSRRFSLSVIISFGTEMTLEIVAQLPVPDAVGLSGLRSSLKVYGRSALPYLWMK